MLDWEQSGPPDINLRFNVVFEQVQLSLHVYEVREKEVLRELGVQSIALPEKYHVA